MNEPVYVYRCYSTYHDDKDSIVYEYGTFSSYEKARKRLEDIISKKEGDWKWSETGHSVSLEGGWPGEDDTHYIDKIQLDFEWTDKTTVNT